MKLWASLALGLLAHSAAAKNSTYYNPVLPGWHSDPSCTQVDGIFYCVTSTFISFPGLPIYASRDLINWKHVSHVWNRESQLPGYSWATVGQQEGMFAATIRHHNGVFFVVCEYLGAGKNPGVLFTSTDPFSDAAWSDALTFPVNKIDPDIFWDPADGNKTYIATQTTQLQQLLPNNTLTPPVPLWNGTGGVWPEGPHLYYRAPYYYLLIAEGGTALDHSITMARSTSISGPYTPAPHNPVLTNRGTDSYFQTVGHGDLFQDLKGNWWGMALATRCGPEYKYYPMGRETVLFPVTWNDGEFPVMGAVGGKMDGWELPRQTRDVPGRGPFNGEPDEYDFEEREGWPRNLVHWRVPREGAFTVRKGLRVALGRNTLAGVPGGEEDGAKAVSFVGRRQTHSLFRFGVDLEFEPRAEGQEAGVTAFLTQAANVQLGVARVGGQLSLRFNVSGTVTTRAVPREWAGETVRLEIRAETPNEFKFSALRAGDEKSRIAVGTASTALLSGGTGSFVGTLLGVYATCSGAGSGLDCPAGTPAAVFKRWRYTGDAQYISETEKIVAKGEH